MNIFMYDGTFEGLLTSVFYSFENNIEPKKIDSMHSVQRTLFSTIYEVDTDKQKASRVWNGLKKKTSKQTCQKIYRAFLSEEKDVEMLIFNFICYCISGPEKAHENFGNVYVLEIDQLSRKVGKEAHYAIMFIRMEKTEDGFYLGRFEPKYDIFPLIIKHFSDRYADQEWLLYDVKRNYGYYYDTQVAEKIEINNPQLRYDESLWTSHQDEEELAYQEAWKGYYDSLTIKERKNKKLQMQHMPKRFWKYLPEKSHAI